MNPYIDMAGQRIGMLTVVEKIQQPERTSAGDTAAQWLCRCDCGNLKIIRGDVLRKGRATSCGCARTRGQTSFPRCRYNIGVDCWDDLNGCDKCGWNPEVAAQRLAAVVNGG